MSKGALIKAAKQSEIVIRTVFDPAVLAGLVEGLAAEEKFISSERLNDDDDEAGAAERKLEVKALLKKVEDKYESLARPHLDALAKLRDLVKPFKTPVESLLKAYDRTLAEYAGVKAELRRRELAEAAAAAAKRDRDKLTKSLNAARDTAPQKLGRGAAVPMCWQVDTADPLNMPRNWLLPDLKALNDYAAEFSADERPKHLPGVTFKYAPRNARR